MRPLITSVLAVLVLPAPLFAGSDDPNLPGEYAFVTGIRLFPDGGGALVTSNFLYVLDRPFDGSECWWRGVAYIPPNRSHGGYRSPSLKIHGGGPTSIFLSEETRAYETWLCVWREGAVDLEDVERLKARITGSTLACEFWSESLGAMESQDEVGVTTDGGRTWNVTSLGAEDCPARPLLWIAQDRLVVGYSEGRLSKILICDVDDSGTVTVRGSIDTLPDGRGFWAGRRFVGDSETLWTRGRDASLVIKGLQELEDMPELLLAVSPSEMKAVAVVETAYTTETPEASAGGDCLVRISGYSKDVTSEMQDLACKGELELPEPPMAWVYGLRGDRIEVRVELSRRPRNETLRAACWTPYGILIVTARPPSRRPDHTFRLWDPAAGEFKPVKAHFDNTLIERQLKEKGR